MGKIPFTCPPLVGRSVRSLPLGTHQTVPLLMRPLRVGRHSPPTPPPRDADSVGLGLDRGEPAYFMSPSVTRSSQLAAQHSETLPCVTRGQGPKALAYSARLKGQLRGQCLSGTCPSVGHRTATVASLFCCLLKTVASVMGGQTVQEVPDWKLRDLCDSAR